MINFYKNKEIDKQKWDNCLEQSKNAKIYVYSWYLDIVSPNWSALIQDNYKAVFPLPIKKNLGISYLSQPLFTQQLGLFSSEESCSINEFLGSIPERIWIRSLQINNEVKNAKKKDNFELAIAADIENIRIRYSQNVKRNLKKSEKENLNITECPTESLIQLFKQNKGKEVKLLGKKAYTILLVLLDKIKEKRKGNCFGVYKDNKLISAAFFTNCFSRSIFLFSASNSFAKKIGANHFLIDNYIEKNKKDSLILDFEGSMITTLARFYASFGAEKRYYYLIR